MLYAWDIRDEGVDPTHKALTITRSLQSCRGDRYYGEMVQRCTEHSESVKGKSMELSLQGKEMKCCKGLFRWGGILN